MAESTYDTIKYRGNKIDDTLDAAEAGTQKPGSMTANSPAPAPTPVAGRGNSPARGTTNPDNALPETAFHKVKTFFGIKD